MKKPFEVVYFDNYNSTDIYDYDSYKEFCEINDIEPQGEDSNAYYEYVNDEEDNDYNTFNDELDLYLKDHTLVAYGSSGRWNGTSYGGYIIRNRNDFYSMSKDCDYFKIWQDAKGFHLKMSHHDGTVSVDMRLLTSRGLDYVNNCERNYRELSIRSLMCSPYSKSLRLIKGKEDTYLF